MSIKHQLRRIAEVEFSKIVSYITIVGVKLRIFLIDNSFIDVWVSDKIQGRFGFQWERRYIDQKFYRYDNYPDTAWENVSTYPYHFHNESQNKVEASPFKQDVEEGFRGFMLFVKKKLES